MSENERMLKWFFAVEWPKESHAFSKPFCDLAVVLCSAIQPGPERTVALRKLVEAKDAAVRAALYPGS